MDVPEEYGGGGVDDFRYNAIVVEEIQRAGAGRASASRCTTTSACRTSCDLTTDEQKARWLPGIASGELITASR